MALVFLDKLFAVSGYYFIGQDCCQELLDSTCRLKARLQIHERLRLRLLLERQRCVSAAVRYGHRLDKQQVQKLHDLVVGHGLRLHWLDHFIRFRGDLVVVVVVLQLMAIVVGELIRQRHERR